MTYNFSVVVCGCTKNSGHYIYQHLEIIYQLKQVFQQFHLVLYENDSMDNTYDQLIAFQNEHKDDVKVISEKKIAMTYAFDETYDMRTQALAHGRNKLLN